MNRPTLGCAALVPILFIFFLLSGCERHDQQPPPPPKVTVAQPVQRSVADYLEFSGNTQPVNAVQLVARVVGYLDKVSFQDGQKVRKGQLLFTIQQESYIAGVQQAEGQVQAQKAQLEYSQNQLLRYTNLLAEKAASKADVDNWRYQRDSAKANLETAEANLKQARLNLNYTKITAPFDGRIDRRQQDPGNLVGSAPTNSTLALLTQIDPIYVYFNVSEADFARLKENVQGVPGQSGARRKSLCAQLTHEKGCPHEGFVDFAATSVTSTTGTLLMRGVFANTGGMILPGQFARVRVPLERKNAFLVPAAAVTSDQQGSYVLVVDEKNKVERRSVKTGASVESLVVIQEGLDGKEWVVINGILKAVPGRTVAPDRAREETATAAQSMPPPAGEKR